MSRRETLDSWKDIAAYLRREVRTCQLWEKELGLPVHRLNDSPKARVFAYHDEIDRWIRERLVECEADRRPAGRKLLKRVLFAAAVLALMASGFFIWRDIVRPASGGSSGRPTIAVLDFENLSKDASLDFWTAGLPEVLITELSKSRFLNMVTRDQIEALFARLKVPKDRTLAGGDLDRLAAEGGLTQFVTGSFLRAGEVIVVTLSLRDAREGGDRAPLHLVRPQQAGESRPAVEQDGAAAAGPLGRAAVLERDDAAELAQHLEQVQALLVLDRGRRTVEHEANARHREAPRP